MRTLVQYSILFLIALTACQGRLAWADELFDDKESVANQDSCPWGDNVCDSCDSCLGGGSSCGCDDWPTRGIVGFAGLDSFKGVGDGSYQSNFGGVAGLNSALPVSSDYGLNWQLGMSYGVYDFDGRTYYNNHYSQSQQQIFVTTGFFHKAECDQHLSFGLVYDWMINNQWGVFGTAPTLGQWRGQVEYAVTECDAFGIWGCVRDLASHQTVRGGQYSYNVQSRGVSQVNFFWHHKFCAGANSYLWVGFPQTDRLSAQGSLGCLTLGASVEVPLSDRLALYGNGSYFRPSATAGQVAAVESGYDVGMGIVWYFGRHAVSHSINGACGLPYMPVANNSTFLVDQYPTYYP